MRGAYIMLKQTIDSGMGPGDVNVKQLKIFTDGYMMFAHRRSAADSMADFGVGTYKVEDGKVIENVFFNSDGPQNNSFELTISKLDDGYRQVIDFPGDGKHYLLTEDYKNAGKKMVSPLDGAWKMNKLVYVDKNGKEEIIPLNEQMAQYKFYESGHFMWGNRWKNEKTGKFHTGYGYGTFRMTGPAAAAEYNESSTYVSALVGKTMNLKLRFTGSDQFEQTIVSPDGSKQIETYERLK